MTMDNHDEPTIEPVDETATDPANEIAAEQVDQTANTEPAETAWLRRLGDRVNGASDDEWIGDDPLDFAVHRPRGGRGRRGQNRASRRRRFTRRGR